MTRTCSTPGCDKPHASRGLCSGHVSQRRRNGEALPSVVRNCQVCGLRFDSYYDADLCSDACKAVSRSRRNRSRDGCAGEWLTTADRKRANALIAGLLWRGYRRMPRNTASRRQTDPHFSAWTVGHVYVVRWFDPTEQREEAAA